MSDQDDISSETRLDIAFREYQRLQDYYKRTLDERKNLFEYYFKTVTVSASVFSVLGLLSDRLEVPLYIFGIVLLVIGSSGFVLFLTYCRESKNAEYFDISMRYIRRCFRDRNWYFNDIFYIIDKSDAENVKKKEEQMSRTSSPKFRQNIKWLRGRVMGILNSAILCGGILMILFSITENFVQGDKHIVFCSFILFFPLFVIHCVVEWTQRC